MVSVWSESKTKYAAKLKVLMSERLSIEMHVKTFNINININIIVPSNTCLRVE
jgi:hypothetical protein